MSKRRVVLTGLGFVTPLGCGIDQVFSGLLAGTSTAAPICGFDASGFSVRIACEVHDFHPEEYLEARTLRRMDPFTRYAVVSSIDAVRDSGLDIGALDASRIACIMGTGIGGIQEMEEQKQVLLERGPRRVGPFLIVKMMSNSMTGYVALQHGITGPNYATASACASATHAIGAAMRMIQYGDADFALSGGSEAACCPLGMGGFANMKALSKRNDDPAHASRPFDLERDGFVLGEGAATLVLEEREHALARDAKIYAELVGTASTDDAFHMTAPDESGRGPALSMELAIADAKISKEQIDYVNAHGTSTALNDKVETLALKRVFGDHASKLQISSTKSMIGHLLGASGAVETAVTALSLDRSQLHPTINQESPDPDCDLDYIPNEARDADIRFALVNSFGFGGTNSCLVLKKHE